VTDAGEPRRGAPDPVRVPGLPTGTVTFLFTDIEGSTRLWQQRPEAMKGALTRHHALLQAAIASQGGYVFQIVGDAFFAAFQTASTGVAAALAAQRALAREPWGETGPIRVRMALHTGAADVHAGEHKSGEYASGLTLSHAARLLSVAHGGQILVSSAAHEVLRDDPPGSVELLDLGSHRLRDLGRAERIFQVAAPDLARAFPPLASLESVPSNLPRQLTSFITSLEDLARVADGRGQALAALRVLAAAAAWRRARGVPRPDADPATCDRAIASARSRLDEAAADAAWSEGTALTLEQAIGHARAEIRPSGSGVADR
jgi:class 3 adenylate cyclase